MRVDGKNTQSGRMECSMDKRVRKHTKKRLRKHTKKDCVERQAEVEALEEEELSIKRKEEKDLLSQRD